MEFMRKITPQGRKYGIVKIVPPDSWNPSFAINTEVRGLSGHHVRSDYDYCANVRSQ